MCKIGEQCIVDPSVAEEQCSVAALVLAVSKNKFSTILQTGSGSLHPKTLQECLQVGMSVGQRLNEGLMETLHEIKPNQDVGFLK